MYVSLFHTVKEPEKNNDSLLGNKKRKQKTKFKKIDYHRIRFLLGVFKYVNANSQPAAAYSRALYASSKFLLVYSVRVNSVWSKMQATFSQSYI